MAVPPPARSLRLQPSEAARRAPRAVVLLLGSLLAACSDSPTGSGFDPSTSGPELSVTTSPIDIWSPKEAAILEGLQTFSARLEGYSTSEYDMFWRVDAGGWIKMYSSQTTAPHKEAQLNADSWAWNGTGPYRISFQARDKLGRVLAERSTSVFVARANLNLFPGARFYVDPYSNAQKQADAWAASRPGDAMLMDRLARRSQADWFGDWYPDIYRAVADRTSAVTGAGALPVYVAYNIPVRDCNGYSGGGATSASAYRSWVRSFAQAIGSRKAVVILEPDALAAIDCLSAAEQKVRTDLLLYAVRTLKAQPGVAVYIDAGNSGWQPPEAMAPRLIAAGIGFADGFSLNVSNFHTTDANVAYGEALARLIGGKHFVIDTSRNGLGGSDPYEWCNAPGRALGTPPTSSTGHPLADAYLWIKRPGESDGTCNRGPSAGAWWSDYALGLAAQMPLTLASLP